MDMNSTFLFAQVILLHLRDGFENNEQEFFSKHKIKQVLFFSRMLAHLKISMYVYRIIEDLIKKIPNRFFGLLKRQIFNAQYTVSVEISKNIKKTLFSLLISQCNIGRSDA